MRVLLIEDDKFYAKRVKNTLLKELGIEVDCVATMAEARKLDWSGYDFVLCDLFLPDCDNCAFIDELIEKGPPVLVITASENEELFEHYSQKRIVDFIIKSDMVRLDYLVAKFKILRFFREQKVLVVDDMRTQYHYMKRFFHIYYPGSTILQALDLEDVKKVLDKEPIGLVLCDYELEHGTGIEVVKYIRQKYSREELSIIALTASQKSDLLMRFLKSGANDYMNKNFDNSSFISRIDNAVYNLILFEQIKELAYKDYLTKCYTRRYLFEEGIKIFKTLQRSQKAASVALMDLDHFKKINDTYGHDAGDFVLIDFAQLLLQAIRSNDFVVRMGGEEFLIFFSGCDEQKAYEIVQTRIREPLKNRVVKVDETSISYNFSCGIAAVKDDLEAAIKEADEKLYKAKERRGITIV